MADTGFKTTGTVEAELWTGAFTTTLINTLDSTYGVTTGNAYVLARVSDFSFGIPSGATINGVETTAHFSCNTAGFTAYIRLSMSWDDGTSWTSTKEDSVTGTTDTTKLFGSSTDDWGRTWDDGEFANGTFQMKVEGRTNSPGAACRLDYIAVKVYYTVASTGTSFLTFFI